MNRYEKAEPVFWVALAMIPGIGPVRARKLIDVIGPPEAIFRERKRNLEKIPGMGKMLTGGIDWGGILEDAKKEMDYTRKNGISVVHLGDAGYPSRLAQCHDAPVVLYVRGGSVFDKKKVLGIVGTRRPSPYGMGICKRLVEDLSERGHDPTIVSGLAYGIDHCAHKSALASGLETIAVLGHGFRYMYPAANRGTASRILQHGSLVTDFASGQKPERQNFVRRNRIIAGLADALVVVESGIRGGALITADLAFSYNRDVFAFPGKIWDPVSAGCNGLIKTNKAAMVEGCRDIEYLMGWDAFTQVPPDRRNPAEPGGQGKSILDILEAEGEISVDRICIGTGLPVRTVSALLLDLEFAGRVCCLPGNRYRLADNSRQAPLA